MWTVTLGRPGAPVQAGDTIAVVDDGEVLGLNRETGARRWVWRPGVDLTGALAYDDGAVFAGLRTGVCALTVYSGMPRWCVERGGGARVAAAPGAVLLLEAAQVTALAASNGVELWTRDTRDIGVAEVAAAAELVYLAGPRGLVAVDAATGEPRWRAAGEYRFRPHVFEGTLYVLRRDPATDRLEARFTADGTVRYVSALAGRAVGGPARAGSLIVVAGQRADTDWLQAFGTRTGKRRWRQVLEHRPGPPVVIEALVALEHDGRLHIREAARGEEWGAREERLRARERPVRSADLLIYRIGRHVRAVRI